MHVPFRRPSRSASSALASLGLALLLAACGGGGDDPPAVTPLSAVADTLTLANGASGQLLANDRLGSAVAVAGTGGDPPVPSVPPPQPATAQSAASARPVRTDKLV